MTTTRQPNSRRPGRPVAADRLLSDVLAGASRKEACAVLGLSGPALDGMVRRGCPRNRNGTFDLPAVAEWSRQRALETVALHKTGGDSEKALTVWRVARAAREKLRLDQERGALIDRAEVVAFAGKAMLVVRQRLVDMTSKVAPRLVGLRDEWEAQAELEAEVTQVLDSLSRGLDQLPGNEPPASDEASATDEGLDVGLPVQADDEEHEDEEETA